MSANTETLEREERSGRRVAITGFVGVVLYLAATILERTSGLDSGGGKADQLRSFHDHAGTLLASSIISAIGLLLLIVPLLYLFRAAQARNPRVRTEMIGFVFLGLGLFAAQIIVSWIASHDIANTFVNGAAAHKGHANDFAQKVIDDNGSAQIATALLIPAVLGVIVAMVYIPLQATRAGLLTRFWGTLGMALGATMLIYPPLALFMIVLWFGYLCVLIGGWAPNPPPAWAAGEAMPWQKPGEQPERGPGGDPAAPGAAGEEAAGGGSEEAAGGGSVVEGEATPVPRQRGERRKRKRRQ